MIKNKKRLIFWYLNYINWVRGTGLDPETRPRQFYKKTDYDQSPLMKCSSPKFVLWAFARDLIGQSALGLFVGFLSKTLMRGDWRGETWWEVTDVAFCEVPSQKAPHSVTFVWFTCELLTWAECRFFLMLFLMQIKNISELTTTTFNITFLHNWWFLDLRLDGIVRSVCTCAERAEILYNRNTFFNLKVHHRHIRKQDS